MVEILDILRFAKDETVKNVAAMDVLSNGKNRAMEASSTPPISKRILSYVFSKLSTPPDTPEIKFLTNPEIKNSTESAPEVHLNARASSANWQHTEHNDGMFPLDDVCGVSSVSKELSELKENDNGTPSFSEEGTTEAEDTDKASKSQGDSSSSSNSESDAPSKYFRYLTIENDEDSNFLYGLVVPLVARILLVSCPNLMCIVEIPVKGKKGNGSQLSSSDESYTPGSSSLEDSNGEYSRTGSSDSHVSTQGGQKEECAEKSRLRSEKTSDRGNTLHGSFNCSFVRDPVLREKAARLISNSIEALTAKVHIPHHDGSEFTLSRVQPCRHCYVRDEKTRTLCGAKVDFTNGATCEVTVDEAFKILCLRKPDEKMPILIFTFDCDIHSQKFRDCLNYKNILIVDIKRSTKACEKEQCFEDEETREERFTRRLPRRRSIPCLFSQPSSQEVPKVESPRGKQLRAFRRSRSCQFSELQKEKITGEKRERSPNAAQQSPFEGSLNLASRKHAKTSNQKLYSNGNLKTVVDAGSYSSSMIETPFTEPIVSIPATKPMTLPSLQSQPVYHSKQGMQYFGEHYMVRGPSSGYVVNDTCKTNFSNGSPGFVPLSGLPSSLGLVGHHGCVTSAPAFSSFPPPTPMNIVLSNYMPSQYPGIYPYANCILPSFHYNQVCRSGWGNGFPPNGIYDGSYSMLHPTDCPHFIDQTNYKADVYNAWHLPHYSNGYHLPPMRQGGECRYQSYPCNYQDVQMSYLDKVHNWWNTVGNEFGSTAETAMSPSYREMRSPTFSDTVVGSPGNSDDDSLGKRVALEALAMLGEDREKTGLGE
eukprot:jgi/Galph1/1097/GphlegSOOS_G5834.1